MGQSAFADALVQTLLGWLRWLADIAWSLLQGGSGFLRWFSSHWVALLVGLIPKRLLLALKTRKG